MNPSKNPRLVIMQPSFLPWAGYFNLMALADDFVFLDDVQLEKQSWQTRNRLKIGGDAKWMIVPVRQAGLDQKISATIIHDSAGWRTKLARTFDLNYCHHKYFSAARKVIENLVSFEGNNLSEMNQHLIRIIASELGLSARLHRASDLPIDGQRSDRLIKICIHFNAKEYLSPVGSEKYLEEDKFVERCPAKLTFQQFTPQPYSQQGNNSFISHLSVLDVVANIGWEQTKKYITNGELT